MKEVDVVEDVEAVLKDGLYVRISRLYYLEMKESFWFRDCSLDRYDKYGS